MLCDCMVSKQAEDIHHRSTNTMRVLIMSFWFCQFYVPINKTHKSDNATYRQLWPNANFAAMQISASWW